MPNPYDGRAIRPDVGVALEAFGGLWNYVADRLRQKRLEREARLGRPMRRAKVHSRNQYLGFGAWKGDDGHEPERDGERKRL